MKKILTVLFLVPLCLYAQNLREKLQACPVVFEYEMVYYYMPQQNGPYFQLPPERKPTFVNIMPVPWVAPLMKPVNETQKLLLDWLGQQSKKTDLIPDDKSLYLRKMAWCVMLQYSVVKKIDKDIVIFARKLEEDKDITVSSEAKLLLNLVDYYGRASDR